MKLVNLVMDIRTSHDIFLSEELDQDEEAVQARISNN